MALNILYVPCNTEEIEIRMHIRQKKRENQVIFIMITDDKKRHYLAVKKLCALLKGKTSKHEEDFYYLNCFRLYSTKNKLIDIKMYVKIKIIAM